MKKILSAFLALLLLTFSLLPAVAEEEDKGSVTVFNYDKEYNQRFTNATGIKVNISNYGDDEGDGDSDIATRISDIFTTKNPDIDVISFWADDALSLVTEKGFYTDLSQSETLKSAFDELYPNISSVMTNEAGEIIAWPVVVDASARTVETYYLTEGGYETPNTWDELLDVLKQMHEDEFFQETGTVPFDVLNDDKNDLLTFFVNQYLQNCAMNGDTLSFDTEDFRRIAARILDETPDTAPVVREDGTEDAIFCMATGSNVINKDQLVPYQFHEGEDPKVYTSVRVFIINPYSNNKENAFKYIEYFAQKRTVEDYALYQTMTEPLEDESVVADITATEEKIAALEGSEDNAEEVASLKEELASLEQYRYTVSAEDIAAWQSFSKLLYVSTKTLIPEDSGLSNYLTMLEDGLITLDEFIQQGNTIVQMIETEEK